MKQLAPASSSRHSLVFPIVGLGVLLTGFDSFVVTVALPGIAASLNTRNLTDLSWILNGYTIAFAALLVPAGRLSDRLGSKRAYLLGMALFVGASAACAAAGGLAVLVGARTLQATGAALMIPSSLGLILATAPPDRRAAAVRTWASLAAVGAALGPVLGGLLVQVDWRWIFLVNLPLGLVAILAGIRHLPSPAGQASAMPGLWSSAALIGTVACLTTALVNTDRWGGSSPRTLGLAGVAVIGILTIALTTRHARNPILDPALLASPSFGPVCLSLLLFHVAFGIMLLSAVLWLQQTWGWSALHAGLAIAPGPLLVPLVGIVGGNLLRRVDPRRLVAFGGIVFALGTISWTLLDPAQPSFASFVPGMALTGIGVGLTVPPAMALATAQLPPALFATGSAVLSTARQVGIAIGVAAYVAAAGTSPENDPQGSFGRAWWLAGAVAALTGAALSSADRTRTP